MSDELALWLAVSAGVLSSSIRPHFYTVDFKTIRWQRAYATDFAGNTRRCQRVHE